MVIKAIEDSKGGEIYILEMGKKFNIMELAKEIVKKTDQGIDVIGVRPGETIDRGVNDYGGESKSN